MADRLLERAERLAVRARRDSRLEEHEQAILQQREAVALLERHVDELAKDPSVLEGERREAAHRLSDYSGQLGGMYRRAGQVGAAIAAYRQGMKLEQDYRLEDSYNLTNWIMLQVLDDPERLTELTSQIEEAIAIIAAQVEGPRRDQWWAWADLGLVYLLGGRHPEARRAYSRFRQTGARRVDYESVLEVLGSLRRRLEPSQPNLATEVAATIDTLEAARDQA